MTNHETEIHSETVRSHVSDKPMWIGGGITLICVLWVGSKVLDRRIEMSAVGLNVWSSEIRKSMAQISTNPERWTSWGALGYDTTATHEMLYLVPPMEVRVYWEGTEGSFDRMVSVEGIPGRRQIPCYTFAL